MPWFVLITKPRSEKKVADRLVKNGLEVCCPLKTEIRQWSDRKKKVEVPLLPSMVLVQLDDADRNVVFQTPGVLRYLFWLGKPAVVSDKEVEILLEMKSHNLEVNEVKRMDEGMEIELKGLGHEVEKGTVKYISGNQCWIVLHNLGYVIKLNI